MQESCEELEMKMNVNKMKGKGNWNKSKYSQTSRWEYEVWKRDEGENSDCKTGR